jgi:hypothetical protein
VDDSTKIGVNLIGLYGPAVACARLLLFAFFLLSAVSTVFKYESTRFRLFFNMKHEAVCEAALYLI